MPLSTAGKVLDRITLERKRKETSCTNQIATLRIIVKQSLDWNFPVYTTFVDYEKAFYSVNRELKCYKSCYVIMASQRNTSSSYRRPMRSAPAESSATEFFLIEMLTGVRLGCFLSPFLFLLVKCSIFINIYPGASNLAKLV